MNPFKRGVMGFEDYNYAQFNKEIFADPESSLSQEETPKELESDKLADEHQAGISDNSYDDIQVLTPATKRKEFSHEQI